MRRALAWAGLGAALALLAMLALAGASPAAAQPDLTVSLVPTQDLPDGSAVPVEVTLHNGGDVGSPSTTVQLSVDGSLAGAPVDFGPVGAGSSEVATASVTLACGAHAVSAVADPDNLVNESDESNNAATVTARVVPVPSFTWSVTDRADGHTLELNGSASVGCRPLNFVWAVVPGGSAQGETASRSVPAGSINVTLTVTSIADPSLHAATTLAILVEHDIPPWVVAALPQTPLLTGTPSNLQVNATDPDGSVASYSIDMGDGFTTTSITAAQQHAYARQGTYEIAVTVTDNLGTTNLTLLDHTVLNRPPEARIVPPALTVAAGAPVSLSGVLSTDPENTSLSYTWSFGDGGTGGGALVDHAFAEPGQYLVTLTVTDEDGGVGNGTAVVTVTGGAPPASLGPEVPVLMVGLFAAAAAVSFLFARSRGRRPPRRTPPAPRAGSQDLPPKGLPEDE